MSSHAITSIKELRDSGIPSNQAEAIYSVVQSNLQCKDLVTKTDLNLAMSEVRLEIKDLRTEVQHAINDLRTEMHLLGYKFFFALGAASVGIVSVLQFLKH